MSKGLILAIVFILFSYVLYLYRHEAFEPSTVKNKIVCICAASSGIGEQLAYQYSLLGARLILAARRKERLLKVKQMCESLGSPMVHIVIADFANPNDSVKLYEETIKTFGGIDTLILNHVQNSFGFWQDLNLSHEKFHHILEVNLASYIKLATLFTKYLHKSGGNIAAISSMAAFYGVPQGALYSACKYGLRGFFDAYRMELRMRGINNISITLCMLGPTATDTSMTYLPPDATEAYGFPINKVTESAQAIIHGVARRMRSIYCPQLLKFFHYASFLLPDKVDDIILHSWEEIKSKYKW